MSQVKRTYSHSDVNVLTACATLVEAAILHVAIIVLQRPLWNLAFFTALKTRIADAFPNFLGVDNAADLRAKTIIVNTTMDTAEKHLTTFHTQVERDFRKDKTTRDEILTTLGFESHYKGVKNGDQEAAIELLFKFDQNITPAITLQLTTKGMNPTLITDIQALALVLKNANISQETAKTLRGAVTDAAVTEFNDIYGITVDIGVICQDIFKTDKTIQKQFSFNDIVSKLTTGGGGAPQPV